MATCLQLMRTEWFMGLENMGSGLPIITWQGCSVATGPETTLLLEAKKKMKTQVTKSTENVFSQSLYNQLLGALYTSGTGGPGKSRDSHPHPTRKLPIWQRRQTKIPAAS